MKTATDLSGSGTEGGRKKGPKIQMAASQDGGFGFRHITAICAACFAVGLAWPSMMGINLTPKPPGSGDEKSSKKRASLPRLASAPAASKVEERQPRFTQHETTEVNQVVVVSCGPSEDEMGSDCDQPDLLEAMQGSLAKLARCPAADGIAGVLSLGVHVDFRRGHITGVRAGKSTTLASNVADQMLACAKTRVIGTPAAPVAHEHEHYWIYYLTEFLPPGSLIPEEELEPKIIPMSGTATIGFETALVREGPNDDAPIQARLLYGTRVQVQGRLEDWYQIEYGGKSARGWVHAQTLGL